MTFAAKSPSERASKQERHRMSEPEEANRRQLLQWFSVAAGAALAATPAAGASDPQDVSTPLPRRAFTGRREVPPLHFRHAPTRPHRARSFPRNDRDRLARPAHMRA